MSNTKYTLGELSDELLIYFNWSINALVPIKQNAADIYLRSNKITIVEVSQSLLQQIDFTPTNIYRGLLLKEKTKAICPHKNMEYLSFSDNIEVAKSFSSITGFGSDIINLKQRLGEFGYIIQYTPQLTEVLFHYKFLDLLPYSEALTKIGMDGNLEVDGLRKQREITILQPVEPFQDIQLHTQD